MTGTEELEDDMTGTGDDVDETETAVSPLLAGVGLLVTVQGIALWIGAVAHTGVELPLGIVVLSEPQIIPAVIVEGVCGALLLTSAYAVFTKKPWAWMGVTIAQSIALGGVLLGITAIALGAGPHTTANALFHRGMVILLVGGLLLVVTPTARDTFRNAAKTRRGSNRPRFSDTERTDHG